MAVTFKIPGILMHRYMYYPIQYSEYFILSFQTLLELQVLIPERMSKEVETNTNCTPLKQSMSLALALDRR